eukprot:scaffold5498_cov323-Prasinococcus_capsulatus_cf.AAC.4
MMHHADLYHWVRRHVYPQNCGHKSTLCRCLIQQAPSRVRAVATDVTYAGTRHCARPSTPTCTPCASDPRTRAPPGAQPLTLDMDRAPRGPAALHGLRRQPSERRTQQQQQHYHHPRRHSPAARAARRPRPGSIVVAAIAQECVAAGLPTPPRHQAEGCARAALTLPAAAVAENGLCGCERTDGNAEVAARQAALTAR